MMELEVNVAALSECAAPMQEARALDYLAGRLEKSLSEIDELLHRTTTVADRLIGPEPSSEPEGVGHGAPDGCVYELHYRVEVLENFLRRLAAEIERLERV